MSRPSTTHNRDVTMKKEEWHAFVSGLLEQIQEKDDMIADANERVEELEEKVDNMKRENFMLRDEIREKYHYHYLSNYCFLFTQNHSLT